MKKGSEPQVHPRLVHIGTSLPGRPYSQREIVALGGITDPRVLRLFDNGSIQSRWLCLPEPGSDGRLPYETPLHLADKHRTQALRAGAAAIRNAFCGTELDLAETAYLACATSTGFLCPSLTAHYIKLLELRDSVHRLDVVGMGCNAGLNAMRPVVDYCALNPGRIGVLLCVEICSAAYVIDGTMQTAVVNSLFGDGAAAAVFVCDDAAPRYGPQILGFESLVMTDFIEAMRFDFDGSKYSFYLDRAIPNILGAKVAVPVDRLLGRFALGRRDVKHWVIHSGGRKVINAIKTTLGLTSHDVRHTDSVLSQFGNVSSCSFLFSHGRLLEERAAKPGEHVLMITMGPGSTIECCLGVF